MIRVKVASGKNGLLEGLGIGEIETAPDDDHNLIWLDIDDPNEPDLERVGKEFGLHPLAIEDAVRRHQRPKIDIYQDSIFIVFYTLELVDDHPRTREISLFAGQHFLITVHEGELGVIDETANRWNEAVLKQTATPSIGLLVYSLLDAIVDGYFPVVDELSERVDDLEMEIFSGDASETHEELFSLKKDLLAVRRVVAPERDVMNVLVRRDAPIFSHEEITYLQDVYDHLLRTTDAVDTYRDLLSSALDISVSMASFRLDDTVKRMTSASIILMSMALISGIYGMNFARMPELDWQWGYAFALGLMVAIGGGLAWFFRRIDWL
jgi:magnesium transporter